MKNLLGGSSVENRTALAVGALSILLMVLSWFLGKTVLTWQQIALAVVLAGCVMLADNYPIHVRYAAKLSLVSVPLFLMAVLLPRPLALVSAGVGVLGADFITRKSHGLLPLDFVQDPARWVIIIFTSSSIAHLEIGSAISADILLFIAAISMYLLDLLTFSLFTSINIGEPLIGLARDSFVHTYNVETAQYLLGLLGALVYSRAPWALLLLVVPLVIVYAASKNAKEMNRSTRELLENMADAVDLRDQYTGGHSRRVAELTARILDQMGVSGNEADLIHTAARLHDIGKIGIPDAILLKAGPLTDAEWEVMRSHPGKGSELLGRYTDFTRGYDMVLYHHEHWDGHGYPRGIKEHNIPFGARVIAVADAFDAITTDRPYRSGKTPVQAAQILRDGSNTQWDKEIVDALLATLTDVLSEPSGQTKDASVSTAN